MWPAFCQLIQALDSPLYYLVENSNTLHLSLLPVGNVLKQFENPLEALNSFLQRMFISRLLLPASSNRQPHYIIRLKRGRITLRRINKINRTSARHALPALGRFADGQPPSTYQRIKPNHTYQFYDHQPMTIKLKPELSPQKCRDILSQGKESTNRNQPAKRTIELKPTSFKN